MSVGRANLIALAWLPAAAFLALGPFFLLWGGAPLVAAIPAPSALPLVLAVLLASVLLHELVHVLGFRLLARAPRRAVRLGLNRRTLTPFACCAEPVSARGYQATALLPALLLGLVPALVAAAAGSGILALWSWAMLAVAGGDVAAVWAIRRVPARALVLDHPARVGCRVLDG
jgi:Putative zincin peptidase